MKIYYSQIKPLNLIKLVNKNSFELTLTTTGAAIYLIKKNDDILVQTPMNPEQFATGYFGKTIGRFGNRIEGNQFTIDGTTYTIQNNEGPNTLHGGINGVSNKVFKYSIKDNPEYTDVIFTYFSPNLESGFPGNMNIVITYRVYEKYDQFEILFDANTDKTCPCALTNHAFFSLDEKNLDNVWLQIKGTKYINCRKDDLIPIDIQPVPTYLDFSNGKMIMDDINLDVLLDGKAHGFDHHFFFDKVDVKLANVVLKSPKYEMDIYTDFKGTQIYSDNYADEDKFYGTSEKIHRGIAIEPQDGFDNLNLLKPNQKYNRYIKYVFKEIK